MKERALFVLFRISFGVFLVWDWVGLRPYMVDLYSPQGLYAHRVEAPWPNLLHLLSSARALEYFCGVAILLSFCILVGLKRRWCALALCYLHGCVVSWNVLLSPPSDGYIGWLLLACVCVPVGEGTGLHTRRADWRMPQGVHSAALVVLGLTYTLSGLDKLRSELWWSGQALSLLFDGPLARSGLLSITLQGLPAGMSQLLTWSAVGAETLFLPSLWWRPSRIAVWSAMTILHFGVLMTVSITTVSIAMLCFHLFVLPTLLPDSKVKSLF